MPHRDAIRTLIESDDPHARVDAHLVLGQRALRRSRPDSALHHFREAADLDPTDERPRAALLELEGAAARRLQKGGRTSFWRWLFGSGRGTA